MQNSRIPGNSVPTFGRIYADTTREALVEHLRRVIGGQAANQRNNPKYRGEVSRLRKAIASRPSNCPPTHHPKVGIMSDNILSANGQSAFVSAREDAWHRLGTVLPDAFTAEEAMQFGHLGGWNVRKVPAVAVLETGEFLPMPGRYATVFDNPLVPGQVDYLGDVGEAYKVIQNEQHAGLLNALVDESGAHFETAGAIDGGRRVFITMKLPGHLTIGGVDHIDTYIAAINSHDGSSGFTLMVTPVRIVCQNTLNAAFQNHSHMIKVRHTRGADSILIQQAREALEMTFAYLDGFQEQAEQLINTTMTQAQFDEIIAREFGAKEDAAPSTQTRTSNKLDEMSELFADAYTQEGIRNTAWAGFNALTEWADHFSPVRGDDRDTARAVKAIFDPAFKNRALQLMLAPTRRRPRWRNVYGQ